jgi:hypothetical protein
MDNFPSLKAIRPTVYLSPKELEALDRYVQQANEIEQEWAAGDRREPLRHTRDSCIGALLAGALREWERETQKNSGVAA